MLLLIYKNGTTLFRQDDSDDPETFEEREVIVQHNDTLTKGQLISKQRQITVIHKFQYLCEANGYSIYKEIE